MNDYQWRALTLTRAGRKVKVVINGKRLFDKELPKAAEDRSILDEVININEIKIGQPIGE